MHDPRNISDRRRAAALAGHRGDDVAARAALSDPDAAVRATAINALLRTGAIRDSDVSTALRDPDAGVRRRACEVAAVHGGPLDDVRAALGDSDPIVAEVAAWCLGELADPAAVEDLCAAGTTHEDPLVREAAVAALGAIGDPRGLPAILAGTTDKPAVRRRAVLALAPFEGADVDAALARALDDRDWQVREAAELLTTDSRP